MLRSKYFRVGAHINIVLSVRLFYSHVTVKIIILGNDQLDTQLLYFTIRLL